MGSDNDASGLTLQTATGMVLSSLGLSEAPQHFSICISIALMTISPSITSTQAHTHAHLHTQ